MLPTDLRWLPCHSSKPLDQLVLEYCKSFIHLTHKIDNTNFFLLDSFSWTEGRKDIVFLPGPHMLFFFLNLMVIVGVSLTFKPFLVTARRWTSVKVVVGRCMDSWLLPSFLPFSSSSLFPCLVWLKLSVCYCNQISFGYRFDINFFWLSSQFTFVAFISTTLSKWMKALSEHWLFK